MKVVADVTGDAEEEASAPAATGAEEAGAGAPQLLRELCHDLIEPVASIKLLVQLACMEANTAGPMRDRLMVIANEAGRIADICGQVLDQPYQTRPLRLDLLAAEAVASTRLRHGTVIDAVIDPATVQVHPAVIVRILNNLLTNACRAAGPEGRVRVQAAPDGDHARLVVSDSGSGLARGKAGRASLGLEIIGSLVIGCGGMVQMGGSDLGGLCVTITFARVPQPELAPAQRGCLPAGRNGHRGTSGGRPE